LQRRWPRPICAALNRVIADIDTLLDQHTRAGAAHALKQCRRIDGLFATREIGTRCNGGCGPLA
jgi:hypothetical protein